MSGTGNIAEAIGKLFSAGIEIPAPDSRFSLNFAGSETRSSGMCQW